MKDKDIEKDRDWDKEMREVDKLLAKLPSAQEPPSPHQALHQPSPTTLPRPAAGPGAAAHAGPAGPGGLEWLGTWARVVLGLLVGIGMTQWPYTHGCGARLLFYLLGVGTVLTAGVWSSISSWRRRLGLAHTLSVLLILWGLLLAAREVLPRVGYAKVEAPWFCPDVTTLRRA